MPKSPAKATPSPVKGEPYPAESPTKAAKAGGSKNGVAFTEADDRAIMNHVLSISDINLRYNWPELANGALKQYTPKQLKGRWDYKLKNALFPPQIMKMSKQAKEGGKSAKVEEKQVAFQFQMGR